MAINYVPFGKSYVNEFDRVIHGCSTLLILFLPFLSSSRRVIPLMVKPCSVVSTVRVYDKEREIIKNILLGLFSGVRECEGNRFQSCALDVIGANNPDKQTEFVICAMDFLKIPSNCANSLNLDIKAIETCVNGERGTQLQLEAENYSKDIIGKSGFVPTITYGRQFNARNQRSSLDSFYEIVKEHLQA